MDALKQDLICEFHAEDRVYDCTFLHDWDMFAAAQNKYLHIYDSQGTELHCMRTIRKPRFLEFLPYHYLLVSISDYGIIDYLDVSTGTSVASLHTSFGCPTSFAQNPHNAIIFQGTARGTVNMWSPNEKKALVTLFCHHGAVRSITVDLEGKYLVTAGMDRKVKIWDVRTYEPLYEYTVPVPVAHAALSQTNLLALGVGPSVMVWKEPFKSKITEPYMKENINGHRLSGLAFRPFEDQLLLGLDDGIRSVVIPGAGEANFDTFELNPFETKMQRRERNVQKLLDKIRPEQIVLDPDSLF